MSTSGSSTTASQLAVLNNCSPGPATLIGQFLKSKKDESSLYAIDEFTAAVEEAINAKTPSEKRQASQLIRFLLPFAKYGLTTDKEGKIVASGFTDHNGFPHINRAINAGKQILTGYLRTLGFKMATPSALALRQRQQIPAALRNNDPAQLLAIMKTPGIDMNADLNIDNKQAPVLEHARRLGKMRHAEALVDQVPSIKVDYSDKKGRTLLHLSTQAGYLDLCKMLLAKGVAPNKADLLGKTSLHYAARDGNPKTIQLLLENGADPNKVDQLGKTSLHYAVENGNRKTIQLLLENGADPNKADLLGNTSLHYAVEKTNYYAVNEGYRKTIQLLVKNNANFNAVNKAGETPQGLAYKKWYPHLVVAIFPPKPVVEEK